MAHVEVTTKWHARGYAREQFQTFSGLLKTRTGKNAQLIMLSQVLCGALGFFVNILIIRGMNVGDYGAFSLFNSTFMLLGGFFHLGLSDTYVRFGTIHAGTKYFPALRRSVLTKVLVGSSLLAVIAYFISPWAAGSLYHRGRDGGTFLYFAIAVAMLNTWMSFFLADLRVSSNYRALLWVNVGAVAVRLILVSGLVLAHSMSLHWAMAAYVLVPVVCLVVCATYCLRRGSRIETTVPRDVGREMLRYNGWIFFNILTFTLTGNTDAQILAHYHPNQVVANFGVAGRLTLPFYFLITAINTTLLPRVSASHRPSEIRGILSKMCWVVIPTGAVLLVVAMAGLPLLLKIAGPQYAAIGPLLRLQLLCTLTVLFWQPLAVILQAMGRAKSVACLSFIQLLVDLGLDFLWVPTEGAMGAVRATLMINILGFLWVAAELFVLLTSSRPQTPLERSVA